MSSILDFILNLIAKLFGVVLDKFKKPEVQPPAQPPAPLVVINIGHGGESEDRNHGKQGETGETVIEGVIPIVLPSENTQTEEEKSEKFDESYWETLAVDFTKKVRPRDRLIVRDKRYVEPKK